MAWDFKEEQYARVQLWAVVDEHLTLADKTIYSFCSYLADFTGNPFSVNYQAISKLLHIHRNTITAGFKRLVERGYLRDEGRGGYGHRYSVTCNIFFRRHKGKKHE